MRGRNKNRSVKRKENDVIKPERTSAIKDWQKIFCSKKISASFIIQVDESFANCQIILGNKV